MEKIFFKNNEIEFEELGNGVKRKILAHSEPLMLVEVHFEVGAEGAIHTHPHTQGTYVLEGKFKFIVGEEERVVEKGDTLNLPSDIPHGVVCLEKGVLLDIFTPERKDFLKK